MRPSITEVKSILPVATLIHWNLVGFLFPLSISLAGLASLAATILSSKELNVRCTSIGLPKMTETPVEVNIQGFKVRQPGIYDYSKQITMTFVESVDNTISYFLTAWRELCWNTFTGSQSAKSDIEATILIQRLDSKDKPIWQYVLRGCYLADFDLGTLDGVTPDAMIPSITLNYDYFIDGPSIESVMNVVTSLF